jgi:glucose-6-phosphate 1-dehydrogenase
VTQTYDGRLDRVYGSVDSGHATHTWVQFCSHDRRFTASQRHDFLAWHIEIHETRWALVPFVRLRVYTREQVQAIADWWQWAETEGARNA